MEKDKKSKVIEDFLKKEQCFEFNENKEIFCKCCIKIIKFKIKNGIMPLQRHKETKKHVEDLYNYQKNSNNSFEDFHFIFLDWMLKNNIPLSKLDDDNFTSLFKNFFNVKLHSRSYYKNNLLLKFYDQYCNKIYEKFCDCPFYLMFDESPDSTSRKIVNVLIGELKENNYSKPYIIETVDMENVNSANIFDLINFLIARIVKNPIKKNNFKLLISDKAAYAVKVGKLLKSIYPEMKHITCLCHGLHNFASFIKEKNKLCEEFEILFKKFFNKNRNKKNMFKTITQLDFPKLPINTRWGTWIKFMGFVYEEYQKIKRFFNEISDGDEILQLLISKEFQEELILIGHYRELPDIILKLESGDLLLSEQINIIETFGKKINHCIYKEKYEMIWESNPAFLTLKLIVS